MRQHVCVDLLSRFGMIVNTMNLKWINGYNWTCKCVYKMSPL